MRRFEPREYLRLATELATRLDDEAAWRSAVSRAYYAALPVAESVAKRFGILLERGEDGHKTFWEALATRLTLAGNIGYDIRIWRNHADYHLDVFPPEGWRGKATWAVGRAQQLLRALDKAEEDFRATDGRKRNRQEFAKRYFAKQAAPRPSPGLPT